MTEAGQQDAEAISKQLYETMKPHVKACNEQLEQIVDNQQRTAAAIEACLARECATQAKRWSAPLPVSCMRFSHVT